jgi:hypothetical protein
MGNEIQSDRALYPDFHLWALEHGWFEIESYQQGETTHRYFLTPQGVMVCVSVLDKRVIHTFIVQRSDEK